MTEFPEYKTVSVSSLIPYARNSRTHSSDQVGQIAASIKEFGFLNPIIVDGDNGIIAGHGRVLAAQKLGLAELPVIEAGHLSDTQRRAYIIADNKLAMNAGWDDEILRVELDALGADGFDLELTGFSLDEIADLQIEEVPDPETLSENYSRKIEAPIYEIRGEKPAPADLYDEEKAQRLRKSIASADVPDDIRRFLEIAADRHTVLNFSRIAEFYAHSSADVQELMEQSALIIIDYDRAVEDGFVKLAKGMMEQAGKIKASDHA